MQWITNRVRRGSTEEVQVVFSFIISHQKFNFFFVGSPDRFTVDLRIQDPGSPLPTSSQVVGYDWSSSPSSFPRKMPRNQNSPKIRFINAPLKQSSPVTPSHENDESPCESGTEKFIKLMQKMKRKESNLKEEPRKLDNLLDKENKSVKTGPASTVSWETDTDVSSMLSFDFDEEVEAKVEDNRREPSKPQEIEDFFLDKSLEFQMSQLDNPAKLQKKIPEIPLDDFDDDEDFATIDVDSIIAASTSSQSSQSRLAHNSQGSHNNAFQAQSNSKSFTRHYSMPIQNFGTAQSTNVAKIQDKKPLERHTSLPSKDQTTLAGNFSNFRPSNSVESIESTSSGELPKTNRNINSNPFSIFQLHQRQMKRFHQRL